MDEQNIKNQPNAINLILTILLLVASFIIGSLWTNVEYLKKGYGPLVGKQDANSNNQPNAVQVNSSPTTTPNQPETAKTTIPPVSKKDHVRGDQNAKIALVEYSDFECPFCKVFHPTAQKILDSYPGKVMWVYRHFPLSFHVNAQKEAEASECANELGGNSAFWSYTDKIYERTTSNGTGFSLDKLVPLAKEVGLDETKFKECLDSGKHAKTVNEEMAGGQSGGVNGTPGNVIVNIKTGEMQLIPGAVPFEQLKSVIDKFLKT
jgi:protein-disulfide isomerase